MAVISDEVFSDYSFGRNSHSVDTLIGTQDALVFSMSGLSKVGGLPQLKLGWIVISGPADRRAEAFEKLELIADTYLSVSTPVQAAAPRLMELGMAVQEQIRMRTRANLGFVQALVDRKSPCRVLDVEGGWYTTVRVPRIHREEEWAVKLLSDDNVLAQPGFFYDFVWVAYLILSLLAPPRVFREGVRRLIARASAH